MAAAGSAWNFYQMYHSLPKFEDVVRDPMGTVVPFEAHVLWAMMVMLASNVEKANIAPVKAYLDRIEHQEYTAAFIKDALQQHPEFAATASLLNWAMEHQELFGEVRS